MCIRDSAEPLSIALHAVGRAAIKINDTAVVFGVGTIGIMMLKLLKISSANRIIAVDIDDSKLDKDVYKRQRLACLANARPERSKKSISSLFGAALPLTPPAQRS